MFSASLSHVIQRELRALRREILAYENEADLWKIPPGVSNSGGTLALHLCGNLRHFVGALLGESGYVRHRDLEFSARNVSRPEIVAAIDDTLDQVESGLAGLANDDLLETYPAKVVGTEVTRQDFLIHLAAHLAYHLGQVDYHRRIVTGRNEVAGTLAIPELRSAKS